MSSDKIMVMKFWNGRKDPDQQMDGWGKEGSAFEVKYVSWTYGSVSHIDFAGGEDHEDLYFGELAPLDLFYYDGWYYGDFNITMVDRDDPKEVVKAFDLSKSYMPIIEQKRKQSQTKGQ